MTVTSRRSDRLSLCTAIRRWPVALKGPMASRLIAVIGVATAAMLFLAYPVSAQSQAAPSVLVLGSPGDDPYCFEQPESACLVDADCQDELHPADVCLQSWNQDVTEKLQATGLFGSVEARRIDRDSPNLDDLLAYDSVLVYSGASVPQYENPVALGNDLADYIDLGGGVVLAVFANASLPFAGRFANDDYWVIIPNSQTQGTMLSLGIVYDPTSPLMEGVSTLDGGSNSFRSTGTLHPFAERIADWSDGSPLVALRQIGDARRVDLNFFPPSSAMRSDFWDDTTDGARLMANALLYTTCGGDEDGDYVCDVRDNCVRTPNPDQVDSDGNGVGDACEPISVGVFISEVHYQQLGAPSREFIELYVTDPDLAVDLTGWRVTDQDVDEIDFVFSQNDDRFSCAEPFTLDFRDRVIIWQGPDPDPDGMSDVCEGPVREFYLENSGDWLQDTGDDILLQAADLSCRDFMQYETGPRVDPPPADCVWQGPNPSNGNQNGISVSRFDADPFVDLDEGADWEKSGVSTTSAPNTAGLLNEGGPVDQDNDGIPDGSDNCLTVPNTDQKDLDDDGVGDVCDPDVDGDGILDDGDLSGDPSDNPCTGGGTIACDDNCRVDFNPSQSDMDADAVGDVCDSCPDDADNDGDADLICHGLGFQEPKVGDSDNCPFSQNTEQTDLDGDGSGDVCDNCPVYFNQTQLDTDMDNVGDSCDNCPTEVNPAQEDIDADGLGDACDNCPLDYNPDQADENGDGVGDVCAIVVFFDTPGYVQWHERLSYQTFDVYRGDLAVLRSSGAYTQPPGSNDLAGEVCGLIGFWAEDEQPVPPGGIAFFLINGSGANYDTGLGQDSSGQDRPITGGCPD